MIFEISLFEDVAQCRLRFRNDAPGPADTKEFGLSKRQQKVAAGRTDEHAGIDERSVEIGEYGARRSIKIGAIRDELIQCFGPGFVPRGLVGKNILGLEPTMTPHHRVRDIALLDQLDEVRA